MSHAGNGNLSERPFSTRGTTKPLGDAVPIVSTLSSGSRVIEILLYFHNASLSTQEYKWVQVQADCQGGLI